MEPVQVFGIAAVVLAAIVGGVMWSRASARRTALEARERQAKYERQMVEEREAAAVGPLIDPPAMPGDLGLEMLLQRFDGLRSFQDVAEWDAAAGTAAAELDAVGRALSTFLEGAYAATGEYERTTTDTAHVKRSRLAKTRAITGEVAKVVAQVGPAYEGLMERVDLTPDNAKEQKAVLRELRAEKKEIAAQKKEVRAGMASVRQSARAASTVAGQSTFLGWTSYDRTSAAIDRRHIRAQKEAALRPGEDLLASMDRASIALDRRIAWVSRFGDGPDEE